MDIVKRMEEVRLMESRKSLRLMDQHDVDFARLAEGGVGLNVSVNGHQDVALQVTGGNPPRKRCSSASTSGIDVPGATIGYLVENRQILCRRFLIACNHGEGD